MEEKASSHRDLCRCLCVSCRCLCPPLGGWSVSRAASGEGWTIQVTNLAGWAGPAPFGCVSGCSELLLASASPCSVPLPTCEQREASSAREGHSTDRALQSSSSVALLGRCPQGEGKVSSKAGSLQPVVTQRCPSGKGTAAKAAGWFEQLSSPKKTSVSNSQQKLSKLEMYFIWLQCFAALQETSTSICFCGCCTKNATSHL